MIDVLICFHSSCCPFWYGSAEIPHHNHKTLCSLYSFISLLVDSRLPWMWWALLNSLNWLALACVRDMENYECLAILNILVRNISPVQWKRFDVIKSSIQSHSHLICCALPWFPIRWDLPHVEPVNWKLYKQIWRNATVFQYFFKWLMCVFYGNAVYKDENFAFFCCWKQSTMWVFCETFFFYSSLEAFTHRIVCSGRLVT